MTMADGSFITPPHQAQPAVYRGLTPCSRKRRLALLDDLAAMDEEHVKRCNDIDCSVCKAALKGSSCAMCSGPLGGDLTRIWRAPSVNRIAATT